jgi:quinol monooxygenase YgiN
MSVTAIVKLTALPGKRDALLSAMTPAVDATRAQPACLAADLLSCFENPDELVLVEHWTSVVAHENFINGLIDDGGLGEILPLLAGEIETSHYR